VKRVDGQVHIRRDTRQGLKSVEFYTKLLGMRVKGRSRIEQTKGETVGLENSPYYTEYRVGEGLDHLAFSVNDLNRTLDNARKSGFELYLK